MRRYNPVLILAALSLLAACGGPDDAFDDDDGLGAIESDVKIDFQYACTGTGSTSAALTADVLLRTSKATFTANGSASVGTYDAAFRSSTQVRYGHFTNWGTRVTTPTMYLAKSMRSGRGGLLTMSLAKTSGPTQYNRYSCVRSTGPTAPVAPPLPPTVLQYVGEYGGAGHLSRLILDRNGSFKATLDRASVSGTFVAAADNADGWHRITITTSTGARWTGTWPDYQGDLDVVRGSTTERLSGDSADDEGQCDATNGSWTDDDVGPDGTFCMCPAPKVLIWSAGGCVP